MGVRTGAQPQGLHAHPCSPSLFLAVLAAFSAVACAQQGGLTPAPQQRETLGSHEELAPDPLFERIRSNYDRGLAQILQGIPDDPDSRYPKESYLNQLSIIKAFRRDWVRWAKLLEDGTMLALEEGFKEGGWLALLSPGSSEEVSASLFPTGTVYSVDDQTEWHIVRIQPTSISQPWAGIFLVHELSHLLTRITVPESALQETRREWLQNELLAYHVEYLAVIRFSGDRYHVCLDQFLESRGRPAPRAIAEHRVEDIPFERFDGCIATEEPLSEAEMALRAGFHRVSLVLHAGGYFGSWSEGRTISSDQFMRILRALNVLLRSGDWDEDLDEVVFEG